MSSEDDEARRQIRLMIEALGELALRLNSAQAGMALLPFLEKITGLSDTRLAKGNLDNMRPSTRARVMEHARQHAHQVGQSNGLAEQEIEERLARLSAMSIGPLGLLCLQIAPVNPDLLPYTLALAADYDKHLEELGSFAKDDRFIDFKETFLDVNSRLNASGHPEVHTALQAATDWSSIFHVWNKVALTWLGDLISALDAEWGRLYFKRMKSMPYFLWVAPKTKLRMTEGASLPGRRRSLVDSPVRRLLELSYALTLFAYKQEWPSKKAGPSEIGKAADRTEATISNFMDGTKVLREGDYLQIWEALCRSASGARSDFDVPDMPTAIFNIALLWQDLLIKTDSKKRLTGFIVLDERSYTSKWEQHIKLLPDQATSRKVAWPEAAINQSSSASPTRSCQSSGRSSSPRDCQ